MISNLDQNKVRTNLKLTDPLIIVSCNIWHLNNITTVAFEVCKCKIFPSIASCPKICRNYSQGLCGCSIFFWLIIVGDIPVPNGVVVAVNYRPQPPPPPPPPHPHTHTPQSPHFCRRNFQMYFYAWKSLYFHSHFTEVCSWWSNWQ